MQTVKVKSEGSSMHLYTCYDSLPLLCELILAATNAISTLLVRVQLLINLSIFNFSYKPASYGVFGMRERGCSQSPLLSFGSAPSVSDALSQHYPMAATVKLSFGNCGLECFVCTKVSAASTCAKRATNRRDLSWPRPPGSALVNNPR